MAETTEKKPNFFRRLGARIAKFWRDYRSEMKKVVWMSWPDVRKNAIVVVIAVVVIGAVIGVLDFAFSQAITALGNLI